MQCSNEITITIINMGLKLAGWVPIYYKVPWAEAYLHTKWHLDVCSRLATIEMGRKLGGGSVPFLGR